MRDVRCTSEVVGPKVGVLMENSYFTLLSIPVKKKLLQLSAMGSLFFFWKLSGLTFC